MGLRDCIWAPILLLAIATACGQTEAGTTVTAYVGHIRAGRHDQAYGLLTSQTQQALSPQQWKSAMHTDTLADAQDVSVSGLRSLSPGGTCVYTELDFVSHPDQGPYGHYIFYLQAESGGMRIQDVQTYDRIEGSGMVKTAHFDESLEPFACSSRRP